MPLPAVIVETGPDPLGSVVWLHGLGADGHDFEPVVPELRLPRTLPLRFVFPHAPVRPVTVNGGMRMRAWYDIRSFDAEGRADAAGVLESSAQLDELVAAEIARGVAPGKVLLAGFSQGGAIVLHNVLTSNEPRAGVMALSTYLPLPQHVPGGGAAVAHGGRPPVFMAHGTEDNLVPFEAGRASAARLSELGFAVEWHEYPIGHGVCPDEIVDIRRWLVGVYGPPSPA
ncbi:MAG TPA: carboxylesterase [Woeseiaceae bacterium]|nr:carboxylesterase [Woeseiaceae bacterium]